MQTESVLAAVVEEFKEMPFEEMKNWYPDEWIVVGNPIEIETQFEIVSGIPLVHGTDKKIVCWEGGKVVEQNKVETYAVVYTGKSTFPKRFMTGIFGRVK